MLKLDRLTHLVYDQENILKFLEENNAYIDCANDDIHNTNANGKLIRRILKGVTQQVYIFSKEQKDKDDRNILHYI